jgi:3-hydroxyisobutyrate dehydrogenase-like beta-hydroxyacid dehydrogenase
MRIAAKDMHLVMAMAGSTGLPLPVLTDVDTMFSEAVEAGLAEDEYTATWRVMEARSGRRLFGH